MAQNVYPTTEVTNVWASGGGSGGVGDIDEGATPNDSDWCNSKDNPDAGTDIFEVHLGDPSDPNDHTGHVMRWHHALIDGNVLASSDGTGCTLNVYLYEGATLRASKTGISLAGVYSFTADSYTLSSGEAATISDYTDLRLRFTATGGGGSPTNRRGAGISWAELEVPDVAAGPSLRNHTMLGVGL
jgi:hypothetical protein